MIGIFLIIVYSIITNWEDFKAGLVDGCNDQIKRKS
jgi:hypothetical protein